jgi:hypothetical protein
MVLFPLLVSHFLEQCYLSRGMSMCPPSMLYWSSYGRGLHSRSGGKSAGKQGKWCSLAGQHSHYIHIINLSKLVTWSLTFKNQFGLYVHRMYMAGTIMPALFVYILYLWLIHILIHASANFLPHVPPEKKNPSLRFPQQLCTIIVTSLHLLHRNEMHKVNSASHTRCCPIIRLCHFKSEMK